MSFYLISNRQVTGGIWSVEPLPKGEVKFYRHSDGSAFDPQAHADGSGLTPSDFQEIPFGDAVRQEMQSIADQAKAANPDHPLVVVFIHGYNTAQSGALDGSIRLQLGLTPPGTGKTLPAVHVCFDWPSEGQLYGYLKDRDNAVHSSAALLNAIAALDDFADIWNCPVNVCVVAHSMGNYVLQEALTSYSPQVGTPTNYPLLCETVMVGADVDNDVLEVGNDGDAICRFSRRVTVYYNRFDSVLLTSQTAKHAGTQRLGRNGPADFSNLDPKVTAVDCSNVITAQGSGPIDTAIQSLTQIHSGYFSSPSFYDDLRYTLLSVDRSVIPTRQSKVPLVEDSYELKPAT